MAISVSLNGENFEEVFYAKEDGFEQLVVQNAQTIFGDKAVYIDTKKKINTSSLGGTIPDGFLIDLSDPDDPQFYLVEVELQSHDFLKHIFPQITKFFAFYRDSKQRHKLIETMFSFFKNDSVLTRKLRDLIGAKEIYKFLKDTIDSNQNILIIIDNNDILTVEPPLQNLTFEDAVSPLTDGGKSEPSQYTEEFHLVGCGANVKDIYDKLKNTFLSIKGILRFNPTKNYIGVVDKKRIAYIQPKGKKVHLIVLVGEDEVRKVIQSEHHKIVSFSEPRQRTWGGKNPTCGVDIYDTNYWDEIQKLAAKLVEKHQET